MSVSHKRMTCVSRRYAKDPIVDKSLRHSVRDAAAYSVMTGGGEAYFSAFAVFLKASPGQIGMLAALPPLLAAFAQVLSAWLGRRWQQRKKIILIGATVQGLAWIPLALLPIAFPTYAVPLLIACVVVYQFGTNFAGPQWSSLMAELVPPRRRGRFFARRTRVASATSFSALVASGLILHEFTAYNATLIGFWIVFAIAAIARFVSVYHLWCMVDPPGTTAAMEVPVSEDAWTRLRASPFARFSVFFALIQFAVAISSPFFAVYLLRDLGYSYLQFMSNSAVVVVVQFITLNWWGRLSDVFGNRLTLRVTGMLLPVLPALWLISHDYVYLLLVQVIAGLAWAGFSLSANNFLFDLVPADKRATFMAFHNVLTSLGVFCGALVGGYLATHLPATWTWNGHTYQWFSGLLGVFLLSSVLRVVVVAIFLPRLKEVRDVKPMSVGGLIFRVARFHAVAGLVFDIIGVRRPPR